MKLISLCSLSVAAGLMFLAGCQTGPKAQFSGDGSVDVSKFKTFYASPIPKDSPMLDEGGKQLLAALDGFIVETLTFKGYTEAATMEEADFVLVPRGKATATTSVAGAQFGNYGTGTWLSGTPWGTSSVNEGTATVMVACYAIQTEKMVWLGWAQSKNMKKRPDNLFEGVATALYDIVSQFPEHT